MKIAIHASPLGFSRDWIAYCVKHTTDYKIVNCYDSNIIAQLSDCDLLLWHHHHAGPRDVLFAKQLLFSLQQAGKNVFPDFNTCWHFDDKLGQKYLLEAIDAPQVPTWAFYEKKVALDWARKASFPKVFKLRGGAGSSNVKLIKTNKEAADIINKAFGAGFSSYNKWEDLKENIRKSKTNKTSVLNILGSVKRMFTATRFSHIVGRQKGYVLFQEFIADNTFDIRVVVIADKAFAIKRLVRKNDFRASGSGHILYAKEEIDERCVKIAFETTEKLKGQCVAYDFVFDSYNQPLIVEINYGFAHESYFACPGYWDRSMAWHEGLFNAADLIIESVLLNVKSDI